MAMWIRVLVGTLAGGLAMASHGAAGEPGAPALDGHWGGDRLQLVIEQGAGRVEMDCASGTIAGPIRLDAKGRFAAAGTFVQHQAGPQRADEPPAAEARYSGEVRDGMMKLSILAQGAKAPAVYNLRQGARVKLVRCY